MLARIPELSAVFTGNDQMALGLLLAFSERGLSVPGDVSVVGFDDGEDVAYYNPPLTTVRQDFQAVGRRGIEMLVAQVESGQGTAEHHVRGDHHDRRRAQPVETGQDGQQDQDHDRADDPAQPPAAAVPPGAVDGRPVGGRDVLPARGDRARGRPGDVGRYRV